MKMFKDFLEWYNNLDVLPFIEAVEKIKTFYKAKKLDLFKDGESLPGLVLKYLMKGTESVLKDSIVGGSSIIFNIYHEANKTRIRLLIDNAFKLLIDKVEFVVKLFKLAVVARSGLFIMLSCTKLVKPEPDPTR